MQTFGDIKTEVLVRLSASTTMAFYTDLILNTEIDMAHKWAAAYKKWPFTEGRVSTTYAASGEFPYPEGWKSNSVRMLQVGGLRFDKIGYADFLQYLEDNVNGTDKVFSDYGRTLFVNVNSPVSGTMTAYGQYTPAAIDFTDLTAQTVFSTAEEDGNEAIIKEVMSFCMDREKKYVLKDLYHNEAMGILETIWKRYGDEQFAYQTKNRGMWKRFDIFKGLQQSELFKRDQF